MITLRPYQVPAVEAGTKFFQSEKVSPGIIVMPTAAGKSWIIAKIAENIHDNLLVLQPSKELLEQNLAKYQALGGIAEVYSASMNRKQIDRITYATIGSIKSIGEKFREMGFTKMIIDEVHAFPRGSESMLGTFLHDSGITHLLGLTATPLKLQSNMGMDGRPFSKLQMLTSASKHGKRFTDIIHLTQIKELTKDGYWSPLIYESITFDASMLRFNSSRSDYTDKSIQEAYIRNKTQAKILESLRRYPERRSVVVFMPSIADAQEMHRMTPSSGVVFSGMRPQDRARVIDGFRSGKIRVVYNVNIIAIGFDHPGVDCIICARATGSLAFFYQALGRGSRIDPGKKDCLIIDMAGNVSKFGKIEELYYKKEGSTWKLFGEGGVLLTGVPLHEIGRHYDYAVIKTSDVVMPFGKFKGTPIEKIPMGYVKWALKELRYWPAPEVKKIMKEMVEREKAGQQMLNL